MENTDLKQRFHELLTNFTDIVTHSKLENKDRKRKDWESDVYAYSRNQIHPLERYFGISPGKRKSIFYKSIDTGRIVLGKISSVLGNIIEITLLGFADGPNRWIRDLKIIASLNLEQELKKTQVQESNELEVGDIVRAIVTSVQLSSGIALSFNDKLLNKNQTHLFPLGKIEKEEFSQSIVYESDSESDDNNFYEDNKRFLIDLERSTSFINPHSVQNLAQYFGIDSTNESFLPYRKKLDIKEDVDDLRDKQSFKWSMDMVGIGVQHFRNGKTKEAIKCFDQAVTFYPKNVEAYVARGALRANSNDLKMAVRDFKEALTIQPKHRNGRKYLIETLKSIAKSFEKEFKWKEASKYYKDILDVDGEDTEAKERSRQIQMILTQKIIKGSSMSHKDTSTESEKLRKTLSESTKDRISKLKQLLEAESICSETSSSTSSSSSSSSDNDGSDNDWIEKKSTVRSASCRQQVSNRESSDLVAESIRMIRNQTTVDKHTDGSRNYSKTSSSTNKTEENAGEHRRSNHSGEMRALKNSLISTTADSWRDAVGRTRYYKAIEANDNKSNLAGTEIQSRLNHSSTDELSQVLKSLPQATGNREKIGEFSENPISSHKRQNSDSRLDRKHHLSKSRKRK